MIKRRALGDITNSYRQEVNGNAAKKPLITQKPVINLETGVKNLVDPRIYMQREPEDIDSKDLENPMMVACYAEDLYNNFKAKEEEFRINPSYMANQVSVNDKMRCILIDWLIDVHVKFKQSGETLFIAVNIIDRYLQLKSVRRTRLQLVGVAALLIAAKYEEIYPPELKDLVFITDNAYSENDILEFETEILKVLDFQLCVPTAHTFICRYLKAAHADRAIVQLSCYLIERMLQEYTMLPYLPSQIAATAIFIARISLKRNRWSPTLLKYTGYDEEHLLGCASEMQKVMQDAPLNNLQSAVFRKYSCPRFGAVANFVLHFP